MKKTLNLKRMVFKKSRLPFNGNLLLYKKVVLVRYGRNPDKQDLSASIPL